MSSETYIQQRLQKLEMLGARIQQEVYFCRNAFEALPDERHLEKSWYFSLQDIHTYSLGVIDAMMKYLPIIKNAPIDQLSFYTSKTAIVNFLEIINLFEQQIHKLIQYNKKLEELLSKRIDEKIKIIEKNFSEGTCLKERKLKKSIIESYNNKLHEMNFIKETLLKHHIIEKTDFDILTFAWDIRNSMHHNYAAIKNIDFNYPDIRTGKTYYFKFKKGQALGFVDDLIGYQIISVQIQFIFIKIVQKLNEL